MELGRATGLGYGRGTDEVVQMQNANSVRKKKTKELFTQNSSNAVSVC